VCGEAFRELDKSITIKVLSFKQLFLFVIFLREWNILFDGSIF